MTNDTYALFVSKISSVTWEDEQCLIETKDKLKAEEAELWAEANGYHITRRYTPETILDTPDFTKTINL